MFFATTQQYKPTVFNDPFSSQSEGEDDQMQVSDFVEKYIMPLAQEVFWMRLKGAIFSWLTKPRK
jgi:hypothetical protein